MTKKLKPDADGVLRTLKEYLPCALTPDEKIEKGHALASTLENIRAEESRAEMLKQSLKSAMSSLEAKRDELALIVSRGSEIREIEVEERSDTGRLVVYRVRMDTSEIIHERSMTPEERQQQLALSEVPS